MKKKCKLIVLVPVLNEAENIDQLVKKIFKLNLNLFLFFVVTTLNMKENQTLRAVKKYAKQNHNIFYIQNSKRGLGRAYLQGIKYILKNFAFSFLCTLDGDQSHNPKFIKKFLENTAGADVIIGSRYIKGGEIKNWKKQRLWISKLANSLFYSFLKLKVKDVTSGFRLYSRNALQKIDFSSFKYKGFVFQAEILTKIAKNGKTFLEIPYQFQGRERGKSKFRMKDVSEYIPLVGTIIFSGINQKIYLFLKRMIWYLKLAKRILEIKFSNSWFKKEYFKPYRLTVKITNDCNLRCKTCGIWKEKPKLYLPREKQKKIFKKYGKDIFFLTITGGEPFLNPSHLIKFVKLANEMCPNLGYISINTNGFFSKTIFRTTNYFLQKYPFLKIRIGLNFIPEKKWAQKRMGTERAFFNSKLSQKYLEELKRKYKKRIKLYRMFTINSEKDLELTKKEKDLWITFAEIDEFYNNQAFKGIGGLSLETKIKIIEKFYNRHKNYLEFSNKRFLINFKKNLLGGGRKRKCWAGINRLFVDNFGKEYICFKGIKNRKEINQKKCQNCWTPCEAVFDLVQDLFI